MVKELIEEARHHFDIPEVGDDGFLKRIIPRTKRNLRDKADDTSAAVIKIPAA